MTELPRLLPRRELLEPARRDLRGEQEALAGRLPARGRRRRRAGARRPRPGDALRAHARGLARRLPAHRPPRLLLHLRSLRPRHRLDVQHARQVAGHVPRAAVAGAGVVAQPAHHLDRLAAGPQRLHAPGSRLPRRGAEQEPGRVPHLPAAGRQHAALRGRPLPAEHRLHQRHRLRQAEAPAVHDHGRGHRPLHQGHQHLAPGEQRRGRRARRRDGLRRRHPHQGGAGRGGAAARALPRPQDPLRQRRRPLQAHAVERAPARPVGPGLRQPVHHRQAGHLQLPRLPVADPPPDLPAHEPPEPPRARLQGEGQHQHAARSGHPEPDRPLQPRDRRHRPRARAAAWPARTPRRSCATCRSSASTTPTSTASTSPRSTSGSGRTEAMSPRVFPGSATLQRGFRHRAPARCSQQRALAQAIQIEGKKVSLQVFGGKEATEECTTAECSFRKG